MTQSDLEPIHVGGSAIESVSFFHHLGSVMECCGGVNAELTARVSRAATIFGAMRRSVFPTSCCAYKENGLSSCSTGSPIVCCRNMAN